MTSLSCWVANPVNYFGENQNELEEILRTAWPSGALRVPGSHSKTDHGNTEYNCLKCSELPFCRCHRAAAGRSEHWWRQCSSVGCWMPPSPRPSGISAQGPCRYQRNTRPRTAGSWYSPVPLHIAERIKKGIKKHSFVKSSKEPIIDIPKILYIPEQRIWKIVFIFSLKIQLRTKNWNWVVDLESVLSTTKLFIVRVTTIFPALVCVQRSSKRRSNLAFSFAQKKNVKLRKFYKHVILLRA